MLQPFGFEKINDTEAAQYLKVDTDSECGWKGFNH